MEDMTMTKDGWHFLAWFVLGLPAAGSWVAAGVAWLISPHLSEPLDPFKWAQVIAQGWYGAIIMVAALLLLFRLFRA
jgi:hypothetical protein